MADFYTPEQRREYMAKYRAKRMAWAHERLGGKCAVCGTVQDLQFDHVDPSSKVEAVSRMLHHSKAKFEAEVDKCQLLCRQHHLEKSLANGEFTRNRVKPSVKHGTENAYNRRGCRCDPCKEAKRLSRKRNV